MTRLPSEKKESITAVEAKQLGKQVQSGDTVLSILENINLTVKAGETVSIMGASGSGKSTLLSLLAGLDVPTSGHVILHGQDLNALDEDGRALMRAKSVGFVFQSFHLMQSLTALENVMLPLELVNHENARQQALDTLQRVGLSERTHHYPAQLSGGEQQRVALARAFAISPKILFADEVTGNLDRKTGAKIIDLLFELNKADGTTLILVTHEEPLATRCDSRYELRDGALC